MAKIALDLQKALACKEENGSPGNTVATTFASGDGWSVSDVLCTAGPNDKPFEEAHPDVCIAIVAAGTFQYFSERGNGLMTPGSLLLGNATQCFHCGHEHGSGDRCISFSYSPEYFARIASDAGVNGRADFKTHRLPPLRASSKLVAEACRGLAGIDSPDWEELGIRLAALVLGLGDGAVGRIPPRNAEAAVASIVRKIEGNPAYEYALNDLAREAFLSPFHFLRTFEKVTGVTPHQFILRARLREAALRISEESANVSEIAVSCGFGDLSNFNRAFKAEFGVSPKALRGR